MNLYLRHTKISTFKQNRYRIFILLLQMKAKNKKNILTHFSFIFLVFHQREFSHLSQVYLPRKSYKLLKNTQPQKNKCEQFLKKTVMKARKRRNERKGNKRKKRNLICVTLENGFFFLRRIIKKHVFLICQATGKCSKSLLFFF